MQLESDVLWSQTHGSGMSLTRSDLLDMSIRELLALREQVSKRRKAEAEAIRAAASQR